MAVQAQYPSNAFRVQNWDELQLQQQIRENQSANLLRNYGNYGLQNQYQQQILNGTVFSDPESELTCNASGSRKRTRAEQMQIPLPQQQQQMWHLVNLPKEKISCEENRLMESAATSTSGRSAISSSPLSQELVALLYHQSMETDALLRLQSEKLRLGLHEARKRHLRSLLSSVEQQLSKRLKEKDAELDAVRRRNAELEEKVKQMSAENQIWCHVARNNEAIVTNLRTSLEQVLLQNSGATVPAAVKEGYGDSSDGLTAAAAADDAQSCCYEGELPEGETKKAVKENQALKLKKACKVCGEKEVSVLLLPCRHLCLCKECESRIDACPICSGKKNASWQIFMS